MTLYHYNSLDKTNHDCVLCHKGVFFGERKSEEYKIALYQIDGTYAHVFYHSRR